MANATKTGAATHRVTPSSSITPMYVSVWDNIGATTHVATPSSSVTWTPITLNNVTHTGLCEHVLTPEHSKSTSTGSPSNNKTHYGELTHVLTPESTSYKTAKYMRGGAVVSGTVLTQKRTVCSMYGGSVCAGEIHISAMVFCCASRVVGGTPFTQHSIITPDMRYVYSIAVQSATILCTETTATLVQT